MKQQEAEIPGFTREKGVPYAAAKAFPSGDLAKRGIKHVIFSNVLPSHEALTSRMVAKCVGNALLEADKVGAKSLAVPAIGTGFIGAIQGFSMADSIEGTLLGLEEYAKNAAGDRVVESLSLVIYAQPTNKNAEDVRGFINEAINKLPNVKRMTGEANETQPTVKKDVLTPREDLLMAGVEQVTESAEEQIRELLAKHTDLVSTDTIDQIVERETRAAREDYRQKRLEGKANDDWSGEPGVTVVVSTQVKDKLLKVCQDSAYPRQHVEEVAKGIWHLKFPKGIYSAGGGGIQFYLEPGREEGQPMYQAKHPLSAPYGSVIRIEGSQNHLWQNANYNWDGTPKNS